MECISLFSSPHATFAGHASSLSGHQHTHCPQNLLCSNNK